MRIGELAERVGVPPDTVRFYERAGWLPRPPRRANGYREYRESDVEHLRLLIDLRRLELPLDDAAQVATWCHAGHCTSTTESLPAMLEARRAEIAGRMDRLRALDARLADLQGHLGGSAPAQSNDPTARLAPSTPVSRTGRALAVVDAGGPCCSAAGSIVDVAEGGCSCCNASPDA